MSKILWALPVPSTALYNTPQLQQLPQRVCTLKFDYEEEESGDLKTLKLSFGGVEAYKCTHHNACNLEMIRTAYDRLVDLGNTQWLSEINENLKDVEKLKALKHMMIYFDDGPCYEFICSSFHVE